MTNYKIMRYLELAMDPAFADSDQSAVVDFAICLPTLLGYVPRTRLTHMQADIPLTI